MNKKVNIKVYGKWILAGEYIVLKSYQALAFPLDSQFIELAYQESTQDLIIEDKPSLDKKLLFKKDFFEVVLNQALKNISKNKKDIKGKITLNFKIYFGAGIGASAVVCVLIGRLFQHLNWLTKDTLFSFCHTLEHTFHGQSSGVDIATVITNKPILYQLQKKYKPSIKIFTPKWQPMIFLSYCNAGVSTKINIQNVKKFWNKQPQKAHLLDQKMAQAVLEAHKILSHPFKEEYSLKFLTKAFLLAEQCFIEWGLINNDLKQHIKFLKQQGALAVKPTGSGSGGAVLSLWSTLPPIGLKKELTLVF